MTDDWQAAVRPVSAAGAAHRGATVQGLSAVLIWGTSIAATRLIADWMGPLRGPVLSLALSGAVGSILLLGRAAERRKLLLVPARYWIVCGGLFVFYLLCYNLGVGLARDGREVLVFGVLNHLWPSLTLAFAAAMSRGRVRWWIAPGLAAAIAGTVLAVATRPAAGGAALSGLAAAAAAVLSRPTVLVLGLSCGVSWALYSALARRLAGSIEANPVPLLLLASAAALAILGLVGPRLGLPAVSLAAPAGRSGRSAAGVAAFLWRALVVDLAAYAFWDTAMRRGNQVLVAAASFVTPLLSAAAVAVAVGVDPGWRLWAASALVVAAAATCWSAVRDRSG
jgi:drug/metabolite transporter (DMT)-like permease